MAQPAITNTATLPVYLTDLQGLWLGTSANTSQTLDEQALRAGRAFLVSTGVQSVSTGNFLNYTLSNPANSGVNLVIIRRSFFNNIAGGSTPLEYTQRNNPTTIPATLGTSVNRRTGGPASAVQFRFEMAAASLAGGTAAAGGIIPTGGAALVFETQIILGPGQTIGYTQGGSGGGLGAAARLAGSLVWYEESVT